MNKLSLFSGIGGIDLAAEWAGMKTVAFCEREPFPQKVLKKHWPNVPIYDDVCELTAERLREDGIIGTDRTIDIISAGYPCQPFSVAGNRAGKEDDRHLWPEVARLLREIRPRWFLGENVAGHITLGLDDVLAELESIGYTSQAFVIPSAAVGAPHRRDRVFIVGYAEHDGSYGATIRRSSNSTGDNYEKGQGKACKSKGTSRSACNENVGYTSGSGLPEWGQSRISTSGTEAEPGMEPEPERSSEDVANSEGERSREARRDKPERSEKWTSRGSENVGNSDSISIQGQQSIRNETPCGRNSTREYQGTSDGARKQRSIESRLGGMLDGLSSWLDGYNWPAGLGAEQYDWEPPRVATGVKDRVGRLKALGNAVNPVQIYPVLLALKAIDETITMYRWGLNE